MVQRYPIPIRQQVFKNLYNVIRMLYFSEGG